MVQQRLGEDVLEQRMLVARQQVERLAQQAEELRQIAERWQEYLGHLERARELEEQLRPEVMQAVNGHAEVQQNEHRQLSVTDMLIYFTFSQPNRQVTNRVATDWAWREQIYPDHDAARAGVAGTFAHRTTLWRRLRKGQYALTRVGTQRAEHIARQMQPHLPHTQLFVVGSPVIS